MPERGCGYKTTPVSSILCLSQIRMEANIAWRKAFLHSSGLRCSMAFFWSFPSDHRFRHCRQQSSPMIILGEKLWQCDRINIIGLKEWYRQKNTDFEWYLLVKLQSFLKFSTTFLKNASKLHWEITFPTTKIFLIFYFCVTFRFLYISEIVPIILDYGI